MANAHKGMLLAAQRLSLHGKSPFAFDAKPPVKTYQLKLHGFAYFSLRHEHNRGKMNKLCNIHFSETPR